MLENGDNRQARKKGLILQLQFKPWISVMISVMIMTCLIALVYLFQIPNPNMILIAGLVVCSAVFGYSGGIVAAFIMLMYTLFFFSTDNSFIHFTTQNQAKVIVSLVGIVVDMVFVCELKKAEMKAFTEVHHLTDRLSDENQVLYQASLTDGLTGLRNRLALRRDYPTYEKRIITAVMLDLDNFKNINDRFGHDEGDRVLRETGEKLGRLFGTEHCYRYGGDEFLMICPDESEAEIVSRLNMLMEERPAYMDGDEKKKVGYSIGYVHGKEGEEYSLREMFLIADDRMYLAKGNGKNQIIGEA